MEAECGRYHFKLYLGHHNQEFLWCDLVQKGRSHTSLRYHVSAVVNLS